MLRTVHFHGALRRKFKLAKVELDADSVGEAMRGLTLMLPGFAAYVRDRQYQVTAANGKDDLVIEPDALLLNLGTRRHIHVTPAAQAAGLETILIVGFALTTAVSLAASFLLKPKVPDANSRERNDQSYIFGGGVNSSEQGHPVALIYGERIRVGSIVVSGGITTTDVAASAIQSGSGGNYVGSSPGVLGGQGGSGGRSWEVAREIQALKGGKSGGGSSRVAQESPNTLRSQATVKVVDLVGEGEIGGLVDGLKSVFLDGTPVQNADGSFNFSGYSLEERVGLPDQDPMPGFTQQETGNDVGVDVTYGNPVVRRVADPVVDVVRVTVSVNSLYEQDTTNGDLKPTSVALAIDHQSNGGGFTQVVADVIQGKTNSPYQRSYDVRLVGEGPHDIRLRRITPDSKVASLKNETRWESYFEVTEAKLIYPDSALYGVTVDAKQFGTNIPVRTYEVRGLVIDIPSNYDPVTRTYTGIWDGTFKRAVTSNPAWILNDLIKNNRYGLGKRIPLSSIDKYGLYAVAQYCDGLVPDGKGGTQRRYTINTCITSQESAYNLLASIGSAFRGFVHWGSGSVMVTQDRPEDPTMLVTPANVVEGRLSYQTVVEKQRLRSVAIVYWSDPDDEYRLVPEIVEDDELVRLIGWQPGESVVRFGCTNRAEAHFAARWMLDDQRYANKAVVYDAADDHNFVAPGAVISVADPKFTKGRRGGRLRSGSTLAAITLDKAVTLAPGQDYMVRVLLTDGAVAYRNVVNAPGTHDVLQLATMLPSAPASGAVWALESSQVANRQFRVRSATADEPPYSIMAVLHDPNSYDRVEKGINLPPAQFMDLPTGPLAVPDHLSAVEFLLSDGTASIPSVQFSWQIGNDPRVLFFQARYKRPGGDWEDLDDSSSLSRVIRNSVAGTWGLMVRSVDGLGRKTAWATGEIGLTGQVEDLPNVQGLTVVVDHNLLLTSLVWVMPEDPRPLAAEVVFSTRNDYTSAVSLGVVNAQEYPVAQPGYYWVRTRFLTVVDGNPSVVLVDASDFPKPAWDNITGPNRPANNATDTRDPNTPFGPGKTVGQVTGQLTGFDRDIAAANQRVDNLVQVTIPAVERAVLDADERIDTVRQNAELAVAGANERITNAVRDLNAQDGVFSEQLGGIKASLDTVDARISASATDLTRTFTNADLALGTRSNALEASAANNSTGIVRNDTFNVWTHPAPLPASWAVWTAQGNFSIERGQPGRAGQFYVRTRNDGANVESGFYQTVFSPGPGKYVIDVTVASEAGGLNGAGVTLHGVWSIDFCGDPDTNGRIGNSADGEVRSWSKMVDIDGRDAINVHAMVGWPGFGRTIVPKYLTWHRLSVRPATDGEIKAGKADATLNNPGGVLAKIASYDTTLADLPNQYATAQSVRTLESQVNGATDSGLLRTVNARIEDRATTIADQKAGAVAEQVRQLTVGGGTIDQRISASANDITRGYTDADRGLSTRSTALEAAASAVSTSIVFNDNFNFWPDGYGLPSRWGYWSTGGNFRTNRLAPGRGGGQFCVQTLNDVAEVDSGFVQTIYTAGAGKWVIEVTVNSDTSGLRGAGVTLHGVWNIDFLSDPDVNGRVGDSQGEVRSWTKMVDLDGRDTINVHAMHGWSGFGRGMAAKYMVWHRLALRPATAGEILAGKADTALNKPDGVVARLNSQAATLADFPNRYAAVSRTEALESQVNFATDSGLQRTLRAVVEDRATAIADAKSGAVAESVRVLRGEYNGTVGEVRDQRGVLNSLDGKLSTYWTAEAVAGTSSRTLRLVSNSDGGGGFFIESDVYIRGRLLVDGDITARKFNGASMAREASSSWNGAITPAAGETITVPWSLALPTIPPTGRFIYEYTVYLDTNENTGFPTTINGRPASTQYIAGYGGFFIGATDSQGNIYRPRANASDRIIATTDFAPTFVARISRGSYDTGYVFDGESYQRQVAADYTIRAIALKVTWVAI